MLGLLACPCAAIGQDLPEEVRAALDAPRLRGVGRMSVLGMHIYDARLWVGESFGGFPASALALELQYGRALSGRRIAERSLSEMRRGGEISDESATDWLAFMTRTFPDVKKGDRITGVYRPGAGAAFHCNAKPCGELHDARFAERFFGIWLAPHTSEPKLRDALLGHRHGT